MDENPTPVPEEAIIPQEELDLSLELDGTEDAEAPVKTYTEQEFKQVLARAKKAEEKLKVVTPKAPAPVASPQPNVEELVLQAQGMPEELLSELKAVASVRKVSLIKAQADPIFVAVKEKFEKDQKQKEANLGASRGSGSAKPKVDFNTPNLPRETHKELFEKAMS